MQIEIDGHGYVVTSLVLRYKVRHKMQLSSVLLVGCTSYPMALHIILLCLQGIGHNGKQQAHYICLV